MMPEGNVHSTRLSTLGKWGILLRAPAVYEEILVTVGNRLAQLGTLLDLHSGVPTRANDFFLVRDITDTVDSHELADSRLGMTKSDSKKYRIIEDGIGQRHRIEKEYLKPAISETSVIKTYALDPTTLKNCMVVVNKSKSSLHGTWILKYLQHGETTEFRTSHDPRKGGIPAFRSNVKDRKPYWYSLPYIDSGDFLLPKFRAERNWTAAHISGYPPTDTLFLGTSCVMRRNCLHALLNSALFMIGTELYGRVNLGEGLLCTYRSDLAAIPLINPDLLTPKAASSIETAFDRLSPLEILSIRDQLERTEQQALDSAILVALGLSASDTRNVLPKFYASLLELVDLRRARAESVRQEKQTRRKARKGVFAVPEIAKEIWGELKKRGEGTKYFPDDFDHPSDHKGSKRVVLPFPPAHAVVGDDLFTAGKVVLDGRETIAVEALPYADYIVRCINETPGITEVDVPEDLGSCQAIVNLYTKYVIRFQEMVRATVAARVTEDERKQQQVCEAVFQLRISDRRKDSDRKPAFELKP